MKNVVNIILIVAGGLVAVIGLIGFFSKPSDKATEAPADDLKEPQPTGNA